ncbi:MAG: PEP-CTERM-box response regulator transcription factor [Gammaproteobacteria bacterium]|nr:PEP-CTERM-box response regulator transcription factor [Gammaproteobacteria bacterium]
MKGGPQRRLLVVEDDAGLQTQLRWCFDDSIEVSIADDRTSAIAAFRRDQPQVVTLDLGLPPDPGGATVGFEILRELQELAPNTHVIVITGREEHEHAVKAIAQGAFDYYQKPIDADTLNFVVERAFRIAELEAENARLQSQAQRSPLEGVIAASEPMLRIARMVEKVAPTEVTTLILGETGTGKELLARALHNMSQRSSGPFQAINCAAIPENLLESELFGHEKGAFTGASGQKRGKIEHANKGTLFLDEIGDMPLPLQAKILRFLQERVIERVGGRESIPVDVRVVCATHRDLKSMISEGTFREDLYYRVSEVSLELPPLRERPGDVVLIATAILKRTAAELGRNLKFSPDATAALEACPWPGNVRELENRVKRAAIMSDGKQVRASDLELETATGEESLPLNLREVREQAEKEAIQRALGITQDNIAKASRLLGVTRPTLYNLMSKYGISE